MTNFAALLDADTARRTQPHSPDDVAAVHSALTAGVPSTIGHLANLTGLTPERVRRALNRLRAGRAVELVDNGTDVDRYAPVTGPFTRKGAVA